MKKLPPLEPKACGWCGTPVSQIRKAPRKFCGPSCESSARSVRLKGNRHREGHRPANAFEPGQEPWNKGLKGIHLSPSTEFKPGPRPDRRDKIGTARIRNVNGAQRAFVKVADPNVWRLRAVVVWEIYNGPLKKGLLVHHKDRNTLNDDPRNLQAMTRAQHIEEHRDDLVAGQRAANKGKK